MNSLRALALFLVLALLGAQQAALAHQLWHALEKKATPSQSQLCLHHGALDTVAGAVDAPAAALAAAAPVEAVSPAIALPAARAPGLAPSSRGPPSLL
jgi:hypothetical protein